MKNTVTQAKDKSKPAPENKNEKVFYTIIIEAVVLMLSFITANNYIEQIADKSIHSLGNALFFMIICVCFLIITTGIILNPKKAQEKEESTE